MLIDLLTVTPELAALLLFAAFVAGFIDAIAGGGGLIVVPALMLAGLSPAQTLATNKVQASFASFAAAFSYTRRGLVEPRKQLLPAGAAFLAGLAGALLITVMPTDILHLVMPALLIMLALFFALRKGLGDTDRAERIRPVVFALTFAPLIAFYDGVFGPGAGAFYMIGFVSLAGYGLLKATAHTKILNFSSNIGALLGFLIFGEPAWILGLCMGASTLVGALLGARAAVMVGARLIRPLLVVTSAGMAIRLLWEKFL